MSKFSEAVIDIVRNIPHGRVATYGQIAALADSPRASRQISGVLRRYRGNDNLPWFRVVNSKGQISLPASNGYEIQLEHLLKEGVVFSEGGTINLRQFQWNPE
ncbi:MAG: MGMT family protein [Candidatus Cloacimonetes bacterium]|nr:MGMT family protein [Candidatus Cloacimonadota bacterium]